jgi:hypothetical protein
MPLAHNVSQTTPIKWGQSLAVALVLLIISAHLGMWSRRQRLATEGARSTGGSKRLARRKTKAGTPMVAETTAQADSSTGATATGPAAATDGGASDDAHSMRSAARGYHGRRRRS